MVARHLSVVISDWKVIQRGIAFIGARSTPTMRALAGMTSAAT